MARTKEFDVDLALERAMHTFWSKGFEATSAQDLVEALGINRSSLYGTFGNKEELYRRALALYGERTAVPELAGEGPLRPRLRRALRAMIEPDLDPEGSRGCFACNAAVERGPLDSSVRALVGGSFGAMRALLAAELGAARDRGELSPGADPHALAGSLLVTIEGLHVVAKGTRDRRLVDSVIDTALESV
ncbi:MAG: TetR/AcrR family transcriptional regulator; helix-turn-helix transcriptional regulator [bacterium]|jgi:TetR/AcrR family transcriptional repressor of nem operon|nr:TetR/AcrR family transcriptional regulator; helix-turn-helix transcriptional regulator [bacterium]